MHINNECATGLISGWTERELYVEVRQAKIVTLSVSILCEFIVSVSGACMGEFEGGGGVGGWG